MLKSIHAINSDFELNSIDEAALISYLMVSMDQKENDLQRHSDVVQRYLIMIADDYFKNAKEKITQQDRELVHIAGMLHDIGKIFIEDRILNSKEVFKKEDCEFQILMEHPIAGYHILNMCNAKELARIILYHHKRFDGGGYIMPKYPHYQEGLLPYMRRKVDEEFYRMKKLEDIKGKDIPVLSRMITVADSFDAITSARPYKSKKLGKEAYDILAKECRGQFDPDILGSFVRIKDDVLKLLAEYDLRSLQAMKTQNLN